MNGAINFIISGLMFGLAIAFMNYWLLLLFLGILNFIWGIFMEFREVSQDD